MKRSLVQVFVSLTALALSVFAADPTAYTTSKLIQVTTGPDRVYALADDGAVVMFDPVTLAATFGLPIRPSPPNLRTVTSISMFRDQYLLVAGTVNDVLLGSTMFVQAWEPSRPQPGAWTVPPRLLWTWIGDTSAQTTSLVGTSASGDCIYVGGAGNRTSTSLNGVIVKLRWGGIKHWEQFIDLPPSRVFDVSTHGAFSNVQVVGNLTPQGNSPNFRRGYFQVFAESGGIPGPRHVWPEEPSWVSFVSPAGPGRGVYALGGLAGVAHIGTHETLQILRRCSFDGTLLWPNSFIDPGPEVVTQRVAAGLAADSGGVGSAPNSITGGRVHNASTFVTSASIRNCCSPDISNNQPSACWTSQPETVSCTAWDRLTAGAVS